MSLPLGAPTRRSSPVAGSLRVFDHIPRLREVLAHGGWPGAIYAQVLIENLKQAYERTERPTKLDHLEGGKIYYTIVGPKGKVDVALVGTGDIIPGASPESGNRLFFTDGEIGMLTGLHVQYPIWLRGVPDEVDVAPQANGASESPQVDERVQKRKPTQRVKKRPRRQVAQASGGDRPERKQTAAQFVREVGHPPSQKELARRAAASARMKAMHAARRADG